MASEEHAVEVEICLGSSCFARGNAQNLEAIETYLLNHGMQNSVRLKGCLCKDECKRGPNLVVRGEHLHEIYPAKLREILLTLSASAS